MTVVVLATTFVIPRWLPKFLAARSQYAEIQVW